MYCLRRQVLNRSLSASNGFKAINGWSFGRYTHSMSSLSAVSLFSHQYSNHGLRSNLRMNATNDWLRNWPSIQKMSTISDNLDPNKDSEKLEKERQRVKQQKITKYTLLVMFCMFCGSGVYALLEWGAPSLDSEGNPIEDEFSAMPLAVQYIYRSWHTFAHYEQVLREPTRNLLLPPPLEPPYYQPPFTLVLEMTGVLVNPEWTYRTGWRFKKRPFVDYFLHHLATSGNFEIVIYTYEQGFTAFPLIDSLDPNGYVMYRLFRDSTRYENGVHMKDLNCLNRDLSKVIHIDWNGKACQLSPNNCLTLKKWTGNTDDRTLYDLSHFLRAIATEGVEDVRQVIEHYSQFDDPIEAFKDNQRKLAQQQQESTPPQPPPLSSNLWSSWRRR
ncbi:unnamed protein product [Oppiella nova]|uniref:Mitochondrial import inner membrane translocase subunit TIM50 n=1 Tax=Oppiella nova TaxID=334625 RepID=A0A7R9LXT2_9ACAR|nr:unnamed protein product [Oppiella nova]CAG2168037.1 unnamed protein product [Oppiella nova]